MNTEVMLKKDWEITDDYSSHRPLLYAAMKNTQGRLVELGCGAGSTPLLKKYSFENNRHFVSLESNIEWCKRYHGTLNVSSDYSEAEAFMPCGLLFIDCAPGELRKDLIRQFANSADVIVVHDTEEGANYVYGMQHILSKFKYRIDYRPEGKPHTTAVSNIINLDNWEIPE